MITNDEVPPTQNTITILQCNLNKNRVTTDSILNDPSSMKFTALLLQEQYYSKYMKSSLTHPSWTLIEPTTITNNQPRTAIYINNRILITSAFEPVHLSFSDVTAVKIKTKEQAKPTLLINVYNPSNANLITPLRRSLLDNIQEDQYDAIIICGDFNLHHPLWNPTSYKVHDKQADELIDLMADHGLKLLLPPGTITFPRAETAIDLVWGNERTEHAIIKCQISKHNDHGSDHLPIEIALDLHPLHIPSTQTPYNYAKTDWKTLETKLPEYLPSIIEITNTGTTTPTIVDQYARGITEAIRRAIDETTPRKKPCPFSKRWWNEDLSQLRREANQLRNIYRRRRNERVRVAWQEKKNEYRQKVKEAKEKTWKDFVSKADQRTIWTIKKYVDTTPTPSYIPTLNERAASNEEKAAEFQAAFFPPPPPADVTDINDSTKYPEPIQCSTTITMQQITNAINKLAPDKAPGPDEITNRVLKKIFPTIQHHLHALAQASFDAGHFPTPFKTTTTVILRKPGKPDYTNPKAYRPIALENTLGKVLESVIAELLSYITETHELLPPQHYGKAWKNLRGRNDDIIGKDT